MTRKELKAPLKPGRGLGAFATSENWPSLTGFRGLAALWVFLFHAFTSAGSPESVPDSIAWLFSMGWAGVDIFFTLSAFLLTIPFVKSTPASLRVPAAKPYFVRRFARILPAYYLQCVILAVVFYSGFAKVVFWYDPTAISWLAHGIFWINAIPLVPAYISPWWTLPVELGFYLLLPILAKCLTDKRWWWLLIGIVLSLGYRYVLLHAGLDRMQEVFWVDHLPGRLFQFLIGMLAAFFWVKWRESKTLPLALARNILLLLCCFALIALPALGWLEGAVYDGSPNTHPVLMLWHFFASLLIAFMLIMLVSGDSFPSRFLSAFPLQWLGTISYGLYLWHFPVMLVLREQMGGQAAIKANFPSYLFASFLISITIAFLSWHWLEAPVLRRFASTIRQ
jgi:peptidoglycan/LPS O-acetylase OafA/YrhL